MIKLVVFFVVLVTILITIGSLFLDLSTKQRKFVVKWSAITLLTSCVVSGLIGLFVLLF